MKHLAHQHAMKFDQAEPFKLMQEDTQDVRALLEQKRQAATHRREQLERTLGLFEDLNMPTAAANARREIADLAKAQADAQCDAFEDWAADNSEPVLE